MRCSQSGRERGLNPGINSPMSEYTQMPKVMMSSENLQRFQVVRVQLTEEAGQLSVEGFCNLGGQAEKNMQ